MLTNLRVRRGKRPDLGALDPGCPDALRALIEQAWQQDRKSRPSFERVVEVTESCIENLLSRSTDPTPIREEYLAAKSAHARQLDQSRQAARARLENRRRKQAERKAAREKAARRAASGAAGAVVGSMTEYPDDSDSDVSELSYESDFE